MLREEVGQDLLGRVVHALRERLGNCCPNQGSARSYRVPWADLLKKVFAVDVLACPDCGGRLKLIAFMAEATVACRILDHLGLDSQGPHGARAQAPPELFGHGPDYDVADPSFTD